MAQFHNILIRDDYLEAISESYNRGGGGAHSIKLF